MSIVVSTHSVPQAVMPPGQPPWPSPDESAVCGASAFGADTDPHPTATINTVTHVCLPMPIDPTPLGQALQAYGESSERQRAGAGVDADQIRRLVGHAAARLPTTTRARACRA